ncbi:MAG: 3-oxoacyl-ACP reductase FabG [Planctomycetota bacterium]
MSDLSAKLSGRLALVTGSSKGIGRAIALAFASSGADVVVNYHRSRQAGEDVAKSACAGGGRACAIQADVSREEEVGGLFGRIAKEFGRSPDILVNNAGSQIELSAIQEMPVTLWNDVLALNLTSAFLCARAAIPGMKQRKWGRIINVTSISGRSGGGPGGAHYAAAKAALISLTRSLAKELAPFSITANAIAPGVILTEMHERFNTPEGLDKLKALIPLGRHGLPEDCAGAAVFLASDSASYITGAEIAVNGGMRMD